MNRNTVEDQHRCARADQRRVTGSQIRLANTTPATPAIRLCWDTPSSRRTPATAAASTTVPATARMNRRIADQAPARPGRRRIGTNKASDPSGAATSPASSSAWSMRPFTGRALRTAISAAPHYPGEYGVIRRTGRRLERRIPDPFGKINRHGRSGVRVRLKDDVEGRDPERSVQTV